MFSESHYFYCYSPSLFRFLKMEKKFNYICTGLHEKTARQFWQFKKSEELDNAINEYLIRLNSTKTE